MTLRIKSTLLLALTCKALCGLVCGISVTSSCTTVSSIPAPDPLSLPPCAKIITGPLTWLFPLLRILFLSVSEKLFQKLHYFLLSPPIVTLLSDLSLHPIVILLSTFSSHSSFLLPSFLSPSLPFSFLPLSLYPPLLECKPLGNMTLSWLVHSHRLQARASKSLLE